MHVSDWWLHVMYATREELAAECEHETDPHLHDLLETALDLRTIYPIPPNGINDEKELAPDVSHPPIHPQKPAQLAPDDVGRARLRLNTLRRWLGR